MSKLGYQIRFIALAALAALLLTACDCDGPNVQISFVDPRDGDTINRIEDEDPVADGVQRTVSVMATGLTPGDELELLLDGSTVSPNAMIGAAGDVTWPGVTFTVGTHTLQAQTPGGENQSDEITVTVDDACFNTTFVDPMPAVMGNLRLGPANDTDGEMCGETFEINVTISTDAGDGADATIYVNGTPRGTATVNGTTATFEGVQLGNRGDTPNTLSVEVSSPGGSGACREDFPSNVLVDCMGASCEITFPDSMSTYLNSDDDTDPVTPGFQGEFRVDTDSSGAGQPIRLVIDGNETDAPSEDPVAMGMGGQATFGNVELSDGVHRFQAICVDEAGNVTRSGAVEWTIDTMPCGIAFTSPAPDTLFTDMDDQDPGMTGIQIVADGTIDGSDCSGLRVAECGGIDGEMFGAAMADWSSAVTLSSAAMQNICAEVEDQAGNRNRIMLPVRVRTDAPQLEIVTPMTNDRFCRDATSCTVDLDTASPTCEAVFSVWCTDVGVPVNILRMGTTSPLPGGTADCVADGSAPAPYNGRADFPMVSLPVVAGLMSLSVVAEQSVDGLTGTSSAISVLSDCDPPTIMTSDPMCGATLRPAADDVDMGTPGLQYDVVVTNLNTPKPPVTLTFYDSSMMVIGTPLMSSSPSAGSTTRFSAATMPNGTFGMQACATDMIGNQGCSALPCDITVADLPTLNITAPAAGAVLGAADDCDTGMSGMQITVTATTDAPDGSMATIQVGANPVVNTTVMGGMITGCVDAPEGNPTVQVTVTDAVRGMAMDSRMIFVDSMPPTGAITDFTPQIPAVDRRGGDVSFTWTAVDDAGGIALDSYEVRCSTDGPIDTEMAWSNATVVAGTTNPMPAAGGTMQMDTYDGFRIGIERWCVIRGFDVAMQPTPLPGTAPASVSLDFLTSDLTGTATGVGISAAAIGDLDGDTFDEILVGATGGEAYIFYGSGTGPSTTPGLTIQGPGGSTGRGFGRKVAGLGDINGDGVPDFAISAQGADSDGGASFAGRVWIFFGRASWSSSTLTLVTPGCAPADVCLQGSDAGRFLGWNMEAAGQFDGAGPEDIVLGAPFGGDGRVVVILGNDTTWNPMAGLPPGGLGLSFDIPGAMPSMAPDGFIVDASMAYERMGIDNTTCGDLNGDGRSDLIIGAPGSTPSPGAALLRLNGRAYMGTGGLVTLMPSSLTSLATGGGATIGNNVACVGDVSGDGVSDIAAYTTTTASAGGVRVFPRSGGTYGAMSVDYLNSGAGTGNDFYGVQIGLGWHPFLGTIGDVDGDTFGDLLLGTNELNTGPGSAELFYGESPLVARTRSESDVTLNPMTMEASGGRFPIYIGDMNGDGFTDIGVQDTSFSSGAGRVVVYY